jgi:hypothetical protein
MQIVPLYLPHTTFIGTRLGGVTYITFGPLSPVDVATPGTQMKLGSYHHIRQQVYTNEA